MESRMCGYHIPIEYNKPLALLSMSGIIGFWLYKTTDLETKVNTLLNKDITAVNVDGVDHMVDKRVGFIGDKYVLTLNNTDNLYDNVVKYIYKVYPDKVHNFSYEELSIHSFNEWKYRRKGKGKGKEPFVKAISPIECNFDIMYEYQNEMYKINIEVSTMRDHGKDHMVLLQAAGGCMPTEIILTKIEIGGNDQGALTSFVDGANESIEKEKTDILKCSKDSLRIYYYKKEYWTLLSKAPKRYLDTIYLKKGERDRIVKNAETFFSPKTRDIYLSFGIPYKSVNMIYGPPGTGKTSIIRGLASTLDCDLYVLPVTKTMTDIDFVGAFTYISEDSDEDKKDRIIVIEDIDTLFEERKEGDKQSGVTLQSFLNCMDGFTCVEGTMLFLTANKPEVLDSAMIRSCRIDNKIKLDYADEYQTKNMFAKFLPNQVDKFEAFYDHIKHKEYTTATLQEFLFYNRDCEDILKMIDRFNELFDQNDQKYFEIVKGGTGNFYS